MSSAPSWIIPLMLSFALVLILISGAAPYLYTKYHLGTRLGFEHNGAQVGDTFGGLASPFIAIAGVIVTGLAFYIQFKANQQQIFFQNKQNQLQQFESQFYEMLNLHRENVTEMKIDGYDFEEITNETTNEKTLRKYGKITEGRKVFVTMKTELECILGIYKDVKKRLDKEGFEKCYSIFFAGLDEFEERHYKESDLIEAFRKARRQHEYPLSMVHSNEQRKKHSNEVRLKFNYKPFSGHASRLGHYFRHLFLAVKSIANSDFITDYEERMKYLTILRAQLSNPEQILLFYNWLSNYGGEWENGSNAFFTDYCMIHNLWYDMLFNDRYITDKVDFLRKKEPAHRKKSMFEIDE